MSLNLYDQMANQPYNWKPLVASVLQLIARWASFHEWASLADGVSSPANATAVVDCSIRLIQRLDKDWTRPGQTRIGKDQSLRNK